MTVNTIGPDIWKRNMLDLKLSGGAKELSNTVASMMQFIKDNSLEAIDLKFLERGKLNVQHVVVCLRLLVMHRWKVKGWHYAGIVTHLTGEDTGFKIQAAMLGLMDKLNEEQVGADNRL